MAYGLDLVRMQAPIDKDNWLRSQHVINILTYGESLCIQGELYQNPYYINQGCSAMLQVIVPLLKERIEYIDEDGKKKTKTVTGIRTNIAKRYIEMLGTSKAYITMSLQKQYNNNHELLEIAYRILNVLKMELLQQANDMGFNFKSKTDPYEAYKNI